MKEVLAAIERHLGRSIRVSELDYYQVFGLELYCDDPRRIHDALQQATNRWLQSDTVKYPESAQIVAKLLRQAQGILLNDEKREKYNLQLRELHASRAEPSKTGSRASVSNQVPSDPSDGIDALFPDADPMAPLAFDASTSFDKRTDSRCALLEEIQDPKIRLAELEQLFPSLVEFEYAPRVESDTPLAPPLLKRSRGHAGSGSSLTEQILSKRRRKRILFSVAYILASAAALAASIGFYLNQRKQSELKGKQSQRFAMREDNAQNAATQSLPKVERGESRNEKSLPSVSKPQTDSEPKMDEAPVDTPPPNNLPPIDAPPANQEPMQEEAKPAMASSEPTDESPQWKERMTNAQAAIERADFETFGKEIEPCLAAKTQRGRDQAARLDQLGQLYKIGCESFEEAKKKLNGSSALKMGSTQVGIVESTPEKIVLREPGNNKSYLWNELPFGIAKAILDLSLDTEKPTDVAARAVFFSMAPKYREEAKTSGIVKKNIEGWFKKSVGQGDIRADLTQALIDTYE